MVSVSTAASVAQLYQPTSVTCSVQASAVRGAGCGGGSVGTGLTLQWTTPGVSVVRERRWDEGRDEGVGRGDEREG